MTPAAAALLVPLLAIATGSSWIVGCGREAPKEARPFGLQMATYGTLRGMVHEGKTAGVVSLRDGLNYPHAYAVGALAGLAGEVTALDRQVWISRVEGDSIATTRVDAGALATSDSAALLVVANLSNWKQIPIPRDVSDEDFDRTIEELASSAGRDTRSTFPFLIDGPLAELHWHVLNARNLPGVAGGGADSAANRQGDSKADDADPHADHIEGSVRGEVPETRSATLVGFYSRNHHGIFTHMGSDTHVHVILPDSNLTGHVDHVRLRAGAVLRVPR